MSLQGMGRALWLASLVIGGTLLATPEAEAAKISVKNCQSKTIRLCVRDQNQQKDEKILSQNDAIHSTCKASCNLSIVECSSDTSCHKCYSYAKKVHGDFNRGTYVLVNLDKEEDSSKYDKDTDFTKVSDDPTDSDDVAKIACP